MLNLRLKFCVAAMASALVGVAILGASAARADEPKPVATQTSFPHPPAWVADQTLYEVNLRQFSAEGTVDGFRPALPRLRQLGVGTLWFMPVHPIGVVDRSGTLGSPYAPIDYRRFNPEFGTVEQFKSLIDDAHHLGLHVIIDWVAVHTSPDHAWVTQHPDWYQHDAKGELVHPQPTWRDVVALDYKSAALRHEMIDAMAYWVRDVGVDGFRCDSAELVPTDFWAAARDALRAIKPVYLLAEANDPKLLNYAFDAAYAWNLSDNMQGIVKASKTVPDLINYLNAEARVVPADGFRLNFTTNHDKNAWEGTTREQLDSGVDAFTVLTFTLPGMPLIYNGQEAGVEHRLAFFARDPIVWRDDPAADLYRTLTTLKRNNWSLWNGTAPAPVQVVEKSTLDSVLTFKRECGGDRVVVMLNLGKQPVRVPVPEETAPMDRVVSSGVSTAVGPTCEVQPWGYSVWASNHK